MKKGILIILLILACAILFWALSSCTHKQTRTVTVDQLRSAGITNIDSLNAVFNLNLKPIGEGVYTYKAATEKAPKKVFNTYNINSNNNSGNDTKIKGNKYKPVIKKNHAQSDNTSKVKDNSKIKNKQNQMGLIIMIALLVIGLAVIWKNRGFILGMFK